MKLAIIHNNEVINKIIWDGEAPFTLTEGMILSDDDSLQIGMKLIDGEWIMPEQQVNDWEHLDYSIRIVVPKSLITAYPEMLFELAVRRKLPMEEIEDVVRVYCNEILEQDQTLIDSLGREIIIQDKPEEN